MIEGFIKNKKNEIIINAIVELKDNSFKTIIKSYSDNNGYFKIDNNNQAFKYLTIVKDYGRTHLEYWCTNINKNDLRISPIIDSLEVYGLNVFKINGALDSLMIYFRPMSLKKYLNKENNICPDIKDIIVLVDNIKANILAKSIVNEYVGDNKYMDAYLIQIDKGEYNKIDIKIEDIDNNFGMASILKEI